ncbi:MAG: type II toxin-antitoxin system VapC family toxin [Deltaproteobacteria bacterium]|nr:type II toxin-antitoxin system VapC family toxin [Deltaproteobacteria bacterium]
MKVLLDTHALIWALEGGEQLSRAARETIEDGSNEILVSAVSAWEIAIKRSLGRLTVPDDLRDAIDEARFRRVPVEFEDADRLVNLPQHHRDPFDRMLVAQAMRLGIPIVTRDARLAEYQVQVIW